MYKNVWNTNTCTILAFLLCETRTNHEMKIDFRKLTDKIKCKISIQQMLYSIFYLKHFILCFFLWCRMLHRTYGLRFTGTIMYIEHFSMVWNDEWLWDKFTMYRYWFVYSLVHSYVVKSFIWTDWRTIENGKLHPN